VVELSLVEAVIVIFCCQRCFNLGENFFLSFDFALISNFSVNSMRGMLGHYRMMTFLWGSMLFFITMMMISKSIYTCDGFFGWTSLESNIFILRAEKL
jgi:hypothetical protein